MWGFTLKRAIEAKINEKVQEVEKTSISDDFENVAKKAAGGFMMGIGKIKNVFGKQEVPQPEKPKVQEKHYSR